LFCHNRIEVESGEAPTGRNGHSFTPVSADSSSKLAVIFGGTEGGISPFNDAHVATINTMSVKYQSVGAQDSEPVADKREGHVAVYVESINSVIVFGGSIGTSYLSDTWSLNLSLKPKAVTGCCAIM